MYKFKEVIVEVTTKERAFVHYDNQGHIVDYETKEVLDLLDVKELEVISEENVDSY